ncbi:MAG: 3-dehydroquinate synthase [Rhodospirillaceae bacterium]|jgi:3-dehydroquinate synthase|nr:3-dehydroquinate synthase [Rhodospirillaceae bacterium]MBT6116777.1 3-dehydroquinate synthase [Rhodospirillaceae bacterium]
MTGADDASALHVDLGARGYDILVGPGLLDRAGALAAPIMRGKRAVVVTDRAVADLHLGRLRGGLEAGGIAVEDIVVEGGEETKSFDDLRSLLDALLDRRIDRATTIFALGGGVVGDLAGFAASVALRGVDFVQAPTTLLAQVDSSVGGKTGINTRHGKNLVGSFYQPRLVLADTDTLATLPPREIAAGYAEVVKYGLIDDPDFFAWCEGHGRALLDGDAAARREAVVESCRAKARTVAADEREAGRRALLNLGHTFAHAAEAAAGYGGAVLHGEAVAAGMALAFDLSVALGHCPAEDAERVRRHLAATGLPADFEDLGLADRSADSLIETMRQDKKAEGGALTFVLVRGIGHAFVARDVPAEAVRQILARRGSASGRLEKTVSA